MTNTMTLEKGRGILFKIWISGTVLLYIILMIQTLGGALQITAADGPKSIAKEIWGWLIPLTFPTISLMIGIAVTADGEETSHPIKTTTYKIALYLSIFYLLLLAFLVFGQPLFKTENPLDTISQSNFFIAPLQGLVLASIGYMFSAKGKA
jgi:hypothetical protein